MELLYGVDMNRIAHRENCVMKKILPRATSAARKGNVYIVRCPKWEMEFSLTRKVADISPLYKVGNEYLNKHAWE